MLIQKNLKWIFIIVVLLFNQCKTTEVPEDHKRGIVANDLTAHYIPYTNLQGDFIVKGFISGTPFTYNGKITVENKENPHSYKLYMVVRDLIFLSPLVSININNDRLTWKDHLKNQEKSYEYLNSSILFFSNQQLPAEILIPLLTGNLPDEMLKRGKSSQSKTTIKYSKNNYDVVGFFSDSTLNTLICNPSEDFHQVVYKASGNLKNNLSRYFPESIKIIFDSNEYIEIIYKKIELK
ncbi:MAG: hypothetical protein OEV78_03995 [Spirochaetia bacterium]|nr:hypothetical protein [Spirochaetia bacterium]